MSGLITSWQTEGEKTEAVTDFLFMDSKITADGDCSHAIRRWLLLVRKAVMNLDIVLNSRHHFSDKGPYSKGCGLSSCHVWLWEMDCKEGTVLKHWCFQTVVLEKSHVISLDSKESKTLNLKGNQPWILIRRTDVESEVPILWSPDVNKLVIGNDPDAGKDWRQKKGMTENDDWMPSPMQRTWIWANSAIWW